MNLAVTQWLDRTPFLPRNKQRDIRCGDVRHLPGALGRRLAPEERSLVHRLRRPHRRHRQGEDRCPWSKPAIGHCGDGSLRSGLCPRQRGHNPLDPRQQQGSGQKAGGYVRQGSGGAVSPAQLQRRRRAGRAPHGDPSLPHVPFRHRDQIARLEIGRAHV